MGEFQEEIGGAASAFAGVSSKAAAAANLRRIQMAKANITAGSHQIALEETQARKEVARNLAQYQGQQAAERAFRGAGGGAVGSGSATWDAANAQAADTAAIIESNASAKKLALIAANQPELEDPILAAIQGGIQGLNIGAQIAQSLLESAEIKTSNSAKQMNSVGTFAPTWQNFVKTQLKVPGLDLGDLFGDLF